MSTENSDGGLIAAGILIASIAIVLAGLIAEVTSCSARQNVRHECDVYGKTELQSKEANDVTYSCAPVPVSK